MATTTTLIRLSQNVFPPVVDISAEEKPNNSQYAKKRWHWQNEGAKLG